MPRGPSFPADDDQSGSGSGRRDRPRKDAKPSSSRERLPDEAPEVRETCGGVMLVCGGLTGHA
jgi:hypothetical protein